MLIMLQALEFTPQARCGNPSLSFEVLDAYFSPLAYPGSSDTDLYLVLNNTSKADILYAIFNAALPYGFLIKESTVRVSERIIQGEIFTLRFSGVSIPSNAYVGKYPVTVTVNARTNGSTDWETTTLYAEVQVEAQMPEKPIMLAAVNILYEGAPAPLLPSARNVVVRAYFINTLPEAMSSMTVNVTAPSWILVRAVTGTYINGMTPGGSCYLDLTVDVNSSAPLGRSYLRLGITYVKIVNGASQTLSQEVRVPVTVESPQTYIPEVSLAEAHWGYPDPTPVYKFSRYAPLTLTFVNNGRYSVQEVIATAESQELKAINASNSVHCATTLASGASCTAVLYFDVNTDNPSATLRVTVSYKFTDFGVQIEESRSFTATLPIESYPASDGSLALMAYGWQNNYYVFPNTANATLQVTLANRAPFPIGGVNLKLKLPRGMSSRGAQEAEAYLQGPVQSLNAFTASFTVSVANVTPGSYNATLETDFIVISGGPGVRVRENFTLTIYVNDDSSAFEVVDARWYEGTVGPYTYGAHLVILIRNLYVDGLKGPVLELKLPEGMKNAADNSSLVRATPLSLQTPQMMQAITPQEVLGAILSAQQASLPQAYSRGDILAFTATVNLYDIGLGVHTARGNISYVDAWGSCRHTALSVSVPVMGRVEYIEIAFNESLSVRSQYVKTYITLINHGTSPAYDAYVVIAPYHGAPILIASPAVTHVGVILPGGSCRIPVSLVYNPLGYYSQAGGGAAVTYGPVPFMISVSYRDAGGVFHVFNNSVTVVVEPFIDLVLRDIRAVGTNVSSTVTGVIVNHGSSTAYRVEAELRIGNYSQSTFIGDVEPGSEVAFRVDLGAYNGTAWLVVKYYNIFDEVGVRELPVTIKLEAAAPKTEVESQPLLLERWIIIAGVIVFLAAAGFLIYRMTRKSRLESAS